MSRSRRSSVEPGYITLPRDCIEIQCSYSNIDKKLKQTSTSNTHKVFEKRENKKPKTNRYAIICCNFEMSGTIDVK